MLVKANGERMSNSPRLLVLSILIVFSLLSVVGFPMASNNLDLASTPHQSNYYSLHNPAIYTPVVYQQNTTQASTSSTAGNGLPRMINAIRTPSGPLGMAIDKSKNEIYVADETGGAISVISLKTNEVVMNITDQGGPFSAVYDSGKGEIFVPNYYMGTVSVVNDTSNRIIKNITVGLFPCSGVYDPSTGDVFILNSGNSSISVINDATNFVTGYITEGNGGGQIAAWPGLLQYDAKARAIIAPGFGGVFMFNDTNFSDVSLDYVALGDHSNGEVLASNGDIYVIGMNYVYVISVAEAKLVDKISYYSFQPYFTGIGYDSVMGDVYVLESSNNRNSGWANYASVISTFNNTIIANFTVPVGNPSGIIFDPQTGNMLISGGDGGSYSQISVVSPVNLTLNPEAIDLGGTTTLSFETIKNSPTLSYAYTGLPPSALTQNKSSITFTPTAPGSYTIYGYANDSGGSAVATSQLTVNPKLSISSFSASPEYLDEGNSTLLQVDVNGGTQPFTYTYLGQPLGKVISHNSSLLLKPSVTGNFTITVYVNDSTNHSVNSSLLLSISPGLVINSFIASPSVITIGQSMILNTSNSGGRGPVTYIYTGLPPGCFSSNVSLLKCTPTATGNFTIKVTIKDSNGVTRYQEVNVSVYSIPSVSISPVRLGTDVNEVDVFQTSVNGGYGPFAYSYSVSNPIANVSGSSGPQVSIDPSAVGFFTVTVKVTDSLGANGTASSSKVEVYSALKTSLTISNSTPLLGQTVAISTDVTGGASPYSYSYTGLPPGAVSVNKPAIGFLPTQSDYYNITVHVTDANGNNESSSVILHVIFDFNVVVTSNVSAGSPFTISVNTNETFSGNTASGSITTSGGIGILTYNYTGLPPGVKSQDSPTLRGVTDQPGTYQITVSVKDQAGDHKSHTITLVVLPSSTSSLIKFISGVYGFATIGAIAVAVAGSVFMIRRKRNKA